ncbi:MULTISPECIES: hypothetical protein [unclassified Roseovarius]|uniref:hypothetical protein n=1 Tax=unclassified Roseovarius TaxID=2614913 RepID=UPI00273E087E|nr:MULTISPECIES: hypothetical protein [unclassified Roseovarius]
MFMIENQFLLLFGFAAAGMFGTLLISRKPPGHRAWLLADLIWVVLGGFGALVAGLAGIYKTDSGRIDRQIDIAYAATAAFDRDAGRFRLTHCQKPTDTAVIILCDKVDFLSASTAENAELPLFIAVSNEVAPLRGLNFIVRGEGNKDDIDMMVEKVENFDAAQFLAFAPLDDTTRPALEDLRPRRPALAADFQIIAQSYSDLIRHVGKLKEEWEFLQANSHILALQIIALCLVSFAAPFRLGKSIVELRRGGS